MTEKFTYDVFMSYSSKDKAIVHPLAKRLREDGLKVWLDEWIIKPGTSIPLAIEQGLDSSRILLICMSKRYFSSDWTRLERHTIFFRHPTNQLTRFIPILLEDCNPPNAIAHFAYIDWISKKNEEYQKLLASCQPPEISPDADASGLGASGKRAIHNEISVHPLVPLKLGISADGKRVVSGSVNGTFNLWNLKTRSLIASFKVHEDGNIFVAMSADGRRAISVSEYGATKLWDLATRSLIATLAEHSRTLFGVSMSADGQRAISASEDGTINLWDLETRRSFTLEGHTQLVFDVVMSADGRRAVSGSKDRSIKLWDLETKILIATLEGVANEAVGCVSMSADGRRVITGSSDRTIKVWDLERRDLIATFEGHTSPVCGVSMSADGRLAISASEDQTINLWDLGTSSLIGTRRGPPRNLLGVAMSPDGQRVVSVSAGDGVKHWDLATFGRTARPPETARYTNAKVVLVGESGVGKSGLALRLTEGKWRETGSTHGMAVAKLDLPDVAAAGMEREVWLWDFAGQPDYRLIHQLYMDETALALMVIDPQRDNPFAPLGHWEQAISRAVKRDPGKLLVAARCDRGGYTIGQRDIDDYLSGRGYVGRVNTSAKLPNDPGCAELRSLINKHIPWHSLPSISTTRLFKALKEAVIDTKESGIVLIRVVELEQRLRLRWDGEPFTQQDLRTVISLLAGQGLIQPLDFGDFVLLQPEQINNYGSTVVRTARDCKTELAELAEQLVLNGEIDFKDMKRLDEADEKILLRAIVQTFLDRGLCYRIKPEGGDRLVFPAYFKHDRPEMPQQPNVLVTYGFTGPVDQIYTTLVVRLHYTNDFEIDRLWRYAADFKSLGAGLAGLIMEKNRDEVATIKVYFDDKCSIDSRVSFIKYIHEHLKRGASEVTRIRDYVCPNCGTPVENKKSVAKKLGEGKTDIICVECEERVPLIDLIEEKFASDEFLRNVREMDREAQIRLDNESLELILVGHAFSTVGEAGHIFRPTPNSDWGIDGEIEFKNSEGKPSGQRLYLQLKSGDSYLRRRKRDDAEIFEIKNPRHADYWQAHEYPVMLVIRGSDETIRWMNVTDYLKRRGADSKQIVFKGELFNAVNVHKKWRRMTGRAV